MYIITQAPMVKSAGEESFQLDPESRRECENIMGKIYGEDPSYWPYGLSIPHHNGGVYMIRQASDNQAVGFVGWQERRERMKKVGYYSIGVLPEHRGKGLAKAAVQKIIGMKSAGVDQVKAFIMPHNQRSLSLATRLGVDITFDA